MKLFLSVGRLYKRVMVELPPKTPNRKESSQLLVEHNLYNLLPVPLVLRLMNLENVFTWKHFGSLFPIGNYIKLCVVPVIEVRFSIKLLII